MAPRKAAAAAAAAAEDSSDDDGHEVLTKPSRKERTLVFSTRGIAARDRYLMLDLRDLLPHAKADVKLDTKKNYFEVVNELAEMKNCSSVIMFEARKHHDCYMWISACPTGPSAKFLIQNVHTMAELKLTGNCLKGSRPLLSFDGGFNDHAHSRTLKSLLTQVFSSPPGHSKTKPFVDHIFQFSLLDNRIWFRNYQIVYEMPGQQLKEPVLVEIGPRFVLNPVKVFGGSFGGPVLYANPHYVSPNVVRAQASAKSKQDSYKRRQASEAARAELLKKHEKLPTDGLETVFDDPDELRRLAQAAAEAFPDDDDSDHAQQQATEPAGDDEDEEAGADEEGEEDADSEE